MNVEVAEKTLLEIKEVLDTSEVRFWLAGGTLLGAIRNKRLIPHDHDMDIRLLAKDWHPSLYKKFEKKGFICIESRAHGNRVAGFCLKKMEGDKLLAKIDVPLLHYYPPDDVYVVLNPDPASNVHTLIPSRFYDKELIVDFLGTSFRVPNPPEEYLESSYGKTWKTPIKGVGSRDKWQFIPLTKYIRRFTEYPLTLHFISTGSKFSYPYYLAVLSALKTQRVHRIKLWTVKELTGKYFDIIKDKVHLQKLEIPNFPALKGKDEHFIYSKLKDYFGWKILYEEGGIYMDLDTFSIQDVSSLIGNKEIMAALETEKIENWPCPFNSAVMMAKKGSGVIKEALDITVKRLNQPTVGWGDVGPGLFSQVVKKSLDKVKVVECGVCGWNVVGGGNNVERLYQGEEKIDLKIKVLHLFAYASKNHFSQVSPEYIKESNALYPSIVKKVLGIKEWKPLWNWHNWVKQRGGHYAPIFSYLETHKCYNILEMGTHNGFNAIGMIKTSLAPEDEIHYFGFDLFKIHDEETKAREYTQDYHKPPPIDEVKKRIEAKTKAKVTLFAGDSKKTLPEAKLPKMDFIYIDGGHSIETISSDWENVQRCIGKDTVIFFDDYFTDMPFVGCSFLEKTIDRAKYDVEVMLQEDIYPKKWGQLKIRLMVASPKIKERGSKMKKKFRFHLLGLAHLPISERYMACAFTQKIVKLSKMLLSLGHEVILYGCETSDAPCTKFIQTHTLKDIRKAWGEGDNRFELGYDWKTKNFKHDFNTTPSDATRKFYMNCISNINTLKKPDDFLLLTQGFYHKPVADAVKLFLACEPGVGYRGSYAAFCAFESSYIQNFTYGSRNPFKSVNGRNHDIVIPNYFDPKDFEYREEKDDYFLYIGRLIKRKGIQIAFKTTQAINAKLVIAGQGMKHWDGKRLQGEDFTIEGDNIEYVGYADVKKRNELFSHAKATFLPTQYLEPFGGTSIESLFCGTPALTTNFGVFPETIINGVVGYRCSMLDDFIWAAKNIGKIKPKDCRDYAMQNFSMERVRWMYQRWFEDLYALYESTIDSNKKGWHRIYTNGDKRDYGYLKKFYPSSSSKKLLLPTQRR